MQQRMSAEEKRTAALIRRTQQAVVSNWARRNHRNGIDFTPREQDALEASSKVKSPKRPKVKDESNDQRIADASHEELFTEMKRRDF